MDIKRIIELATEAAKEELYGEERNFEGLPACPAVVGYEDFAKKLQELLEAELDSPVEVENRRIKRARQLLCYESDEQTKVAIEAIEKQAEIDGTLLIDHVAFEFAGEKDYLLVWEPLVGRYTCDEFLEEIGG